ncbi:MAG: carbonic anhydrase [Pseudomonadota bacterium]
MSYKNIYPKYFLMIALMILTITFFPKAAHSGHTDILLLSCMDYRLINETESYMTNRGLRDKYDHVILAGASLGATTDKYPAWNQTFWDHLDVAIKLHSIKKVVVLDHRDCGAYKVILGEDFSKDPKKEKSVHIDKLSALAKQIKAKYPNLEIELLLMDLSGNVETVSD